jgi:hypothetical protein
MDIDPDKLLPYLTQVEEVAPSWMEVVVTGHNFESILPKDHPCHVCFKLADWFQRRRLLNNFPNLHPRWLP